MPQQIIAPPKIRRNSSEISENNLFEGGKKLKNSESRKSVGKKKKKKGKKKKAPQTGIDQVEFDADNLLA